MNIQIYKKQLQETVIAPMTEFMKEYDDCGFEQKHIEKCEALMLEYLSALEKIKAELPMLPVVQEFIEFCESSKRGVIGAGDND